MSTVKNDKIANSIPKNDTPIVTVGQLVKRAPCFFWGFLFFGLAFLLLALFAGLSWKSARELAVQLEQVQGTEQALASQLESSHIDDQNVDQQLKTMRVNELNLEAKIAEEEYPQRSLLLTLEAGRLGSQTPSLEIHQALLTRLNQIGWKVLRGFQGTPYGIAYSPNGRWIVAAGWETFWVWDTTTTDLANIPLVLDDHSARITEMIFSPDGHWFATGSLDNTVRLWDLSADDPFSSSIVLAGHEEGVSAISFSPNGDWLATSSIAGVTHLWNLRTFDETPIPISLSKGNVVISMFVTDLAFSPDSHWLVASDFDSYIYVWDVQSENLTAEPVKLVGEKYYEVRSIDFSPDGRWLVSASGDSKIRLWDMESNDLQYSMKIIDDDAGGIPRAKFSPDGLWLTVADRNVNGHNSKLFRISPDGTVLSKLVLEGQTKILVFSPDTKWLATSSSNHAIRIWDLTDAGLNKYYDLKGHEGEITALAFSSDGDQLISGSKDNTIRLWDMKNPGSIASSDYIPLDPFPTKPPVLSLDGKWLAYASDGPVIELWNLASRKPEDQPIQLEGPTSEISIIAFSPLNHWIAAVGKDGAAWLWDLQNPDQTQPIELSGHIVEITAIAFSNDERWLATGSLDLTTRLWDLKSADPAASFHALRDHEGGITTLSFSSDNHWLATGSLDTTVRLWDISSPDTNVSSIVLEDYESEVSILAFSPGGHWLVSASKDGIVHLRDFRAFDQTTNPIILNSEAPEFCCLEFSSDDRWMISGSSIQLWDLDSIQSDTLTLIPYMKFGTGSVFKLSPDIKWLALRDYSGIRLIDMENPDVDNSLLLNGGIDSIMGLVFSQDSKTLIFVTDKFVSFWRFSWDDLFSRACEMAGRNLTQLEWQEYFPDETYRVTCTQWPAGE